MRFRRLLAEVIAITPSSYTRLSGGILDIDVVPLTGDSDRLVVQGTLALAGTLNASNLGGQFTA